jgi:hypothetical protein
VSRSKIQVIQPIALAIPRRYDRYHVSKGNNMRKPTIYEALKAKLGREPTYNELVADVRRILGEVTVALAEKGRLPHQRRY